MDRFHAITAFVRVVEAGSFVGAADRMGVSVSAVSRQVAELEAHLPRVFSTGRRAGCR
jgi:DNA-binding transcriptional LysR family regulator